MKLTINVTREVLENSKSCPVQNRSENCAIAVAVRDIFPAATVVHHWIYAFYGDPLRCNMDDEIRLPKEAMAFIFKFDSLLPSERATMPEFAFEVEVPDTVMNEIGIDQVHAILKESKTLSLA